MSLSAVHAKKILARFSRQRILVVGDLMLDRYVYGGVSRISPEAPVPVVHVTHEKSMPGGASNVAWNVRSLGGRAAVSGILYALAGYVTNAMRERYVEVYSWRMESGDVQLDFIGDDGTAAAFEMAVIGLAQVAQAHPEQVQVECREEK